MFKVPQYYIFLLILMLAFGIANAQKYERIKYKADELEYGRKNGDSFRKLNGNVIFTQKSTTVYCDTSFFYTKENKMEAQGHVHIVDDSTDITSETLLYKGDERIAQLRKNVKYIRGDFQLYTDFLDYDLETEIAHYFNKGKLIDTTNVLTSEIGYYFAKDNYAQFYTNVVLKTEDFVLTTDTLRYNTQTKIAYTRGPSRITTEDGTVVRNKAAEFRTVSDQSEFEDGEIETEDYFLEGDELFFDEGEKYYRAISNVKMTAKNEDVIITGDEGYYDRKNGISKIFGHPVMKRILEADTFYLTADTLVAIESKMDSLKRILAYNNVKLFKEGLQGKSDSMAYFMHDSIIYFYNDPVMWNNKNQITADTINLEVSEDEVKYMNLLNGAFLASEDSLGNYNQIKGRVMKVFFENNELDKINVNGNGEILYFALEEGDSVLMGMNKIFCASMQIRFKEMKLSSFSVFTQPEAQFIPPHELTKEQRRLENFHWRIDEKPKLFDVAPYLNPEKELLEEEVENQLTDSESEKAKPLPFEIIKNQNSNKSKSQLIKPNGSNKPLPADKRKELKPQAIEKLDDGIL